MTHSGFLASKSNICYPLIRSIHAIATNDKYRVPSGGRKELASIQAHGLLSAKRLAAASGYDLRQLRLHRAKGLTLLSGVRIRDQSPMPPRVLGKYLHDELTPEDWYDLLNSKVFFWLDPDRLNRQRRACGDAPQRVLVIDAARMLEKHGSRAL